MTVSSQDSDITFNAGPATVLPLPFRFFNNDEVYVYRIEISTDTVTPMVEGADYTLAGAGEPEVNGNAESILTLTAPIATGFQVYVQRTLPEEQQTDIINQGKFFPEIHENVFDRLVMLIQQLSRGLTNAMRQVTGGFAWDALGLRIINLGTPTNSTDAANKSYVDSSLSGFLATAIRTPENIPQLPNAAARSGRILSFDTSGNPSLVLPDPGTALDLANKLANNTDSTLGASLVGFDPGLTGDVGRTVQSKLRESISVLDFGATAGAGDSTAAFAAADLAAAAKGYAVHVPANPLGYTVGNLVLTASLIGDGVASKLNRLTGTTGNWITVGANSVKITGLDIDGGWITGNGIEVSGFHNVEITNNVLQRIGGQIIHFNGANNLRIHFNRVPFATNGITNLMPVDSAAAVLSQGTSICNNILEGISGTAIYLAGKQSSTDPLYYRSNRLIADAVVMGNTLRDIAGHGILGQGRRVAIIGNNVLNVGNSSGLQGIVPQGDMVTVIGNVVEGGSGVGIDMGASINSTVVGNTVRNKLEIGIELNSCTNVTCSGNTVESCGSSVAGTNSAGISISQGFFGPTLKSFAISVNGNTVTAGAAGGKYGISVDSGVQDVIVSGNHLTASGTIAPIFVDEASNARATCYGNVTGDNEDGFFVMYGTDSRVIVRKPGGNADLPLYPEGSGQLKLGKFMTNATTPSSFQAKAYFQIKDQAGNIFYVPVTNTVW